MYFLEKITEPLLRSLRSWGYFEVAMAKFWISSILILNGFSFRIFIILSFEVVWPQRPRPQMGLREFFEKLHFWNQCIPRKKIRYVIASWSTFSLNLFTEEVWQLVRRLQKRNFGFWILDLGFCCPSEFSDYLK